MVAYRARALCAYPNRFSLARRIVTCSPANRIHGFLLALSTEATRSWSPEHARWSDVRLEGSVYFVGQRAKTGISRMKFVGPVNFGLQRSGQIDVENLGRRGQSL